MNEECDLRFQNFHINQIRISNLRQLKTQHQHQRLDLGLPVTRIKFMCDSSILGTSGFWLSSKLSGLVIRSIYLPDQYADSFSSVTLSCAISYIQSLMMCQPLQVLKMHSFFLPPSLNSSLQNAVVILVSFTSVHPLLRFANIGHSPVYDSRISAFHDSISGLEAWVLMYRFAVYDILTHMSNCFFRSDWRWLQRVSRFLECTLYFCSLVKGDTPTVLGLKLFVSQW